MQKSSKRRRGRLPLLMPLLLMLLVPFSCDNFVLYDELEPPVAAAGTVEALTLSPANVAVKVTENVAFAASGGTPGYVFAIASGGGGIDAQTGLYTAPSSAGAATVRVSDAAANNAEANVTVVTPSELTIYPESVTVETGASYLFSGTGGITPYTFSVSSNQSGGSFSTGGSYTAGGATGTDTVLLQDAAGTKVFASVSVVSGGPLGISPSSPEVDESGTIDFSGFGGTPGYNFSIVSGSGSILSSSGEYTAPAGVGTGLSEVRITDSNSSTVSTFVTVLPAAPTNLTANGSAGANSDIQLTWSDNSSAEDGYSVERRLNNGTFGEIATLGPDSTSYLDGSCLPNELYIYRVRAFTTGADPLESKYSNEDYDFSNS